MIRILEDRMHLLPVSGIMESEVGKKLPDHRIKPVLGMTVEEGSELRTFGAY